MSSQRKTCPRKVKLTAEEQAARKAERQERERKAKRAAMEKLLASTRSYCSACGGKLVQNQSKRIALCARCFKYCARCGRKARMTGHYEICIRCVAEVATKMTQYDGGINPLKLEIPEGQPPNTVSASASICEVCGDEGEFVYRGRMLCAECRSEILQDEKPENQA